MNRRREITVVKSGMMIVIFHHIMCLYRVSLIFKKALLLIFLMTTNYTCELSLK